MGRMLKKTSRGALTVMATFCLLNLISTPQHQPPAEDECGGGEQRRERQELLDKLHGRVERLPGDSLKVDLIRPSWQPWRNDHNCASYHTRFGRGLSPVLLVSMPCSGSTWLRYLLESSTGFFSGSKYNDTILYKAGFLGEYEGMEGGRTIIQRTHGASYFLADTHDLQDRYEKVDPDVPTILLLRHPAKTLISHWRLFHLAGSNKHLDDVPVSIYQSEDFHDFVSEATSLWEELASDRLLWCNRPLYVLHYEDLVANTTHHLRQLLDFLSVPVDEGRFTCVASHLDGSFKRNTTRHFDPFTEDEKVRFVNAVKRINRLLTVLGYPQLPGSSDHSD
ncbi:WSC domain-containing protein 1-like [Homarus americanus]|uniref:WSC domain-containing protein 1-like n=1 Tax=Homarus americanus TaxID=6706 RepID=UPI001C47585E|nr:WSC domain-containing protein 1-like [Homarus americanus]